MGDAGAGHCAQHRTNENTPSIHADGLVIYFASTRAGGPGLYDIWTSTRDTRTSAWKMPVVVPELCSPFNDTSPALSRDQLTMYFASERNGNVAVHVATRSNTAAAWATPTIVTDIAMATVNQGSPFLAGDALYFTSGRAGSAYQDWNLWIATRPDAASAFTALEPVEELNSSDGERGSVGVCRRQHDLLLE